MKAFGIARPLHQIGIKLWLLIDNTTAAELSHDETRELAYWGIEDNSDLIVQLLED